MIATMPRTRKEDTPTPPPQGEEFARKLTSLRNQRGWTKKALSDASGVSNTYIGILENGGINATTGQFQKPSVEIIEKLARALASPQNFQAVENELRVAAGYTPRESQADPLYDLSSLLRTAADNLENGNLSLNLTRIVDPDARDVLDLYEGIPEGPLREDAKAYLRDLNDLARRRFQRRTDIIGKPADNDGLERIEDEE